MIGINKKYTTRNGFPVKIKRINPSGNIDGAVKFPNVGWADSIWYENGDFKDNFEETSLDLIEVEAEDDSKRR